MEGRTNRAFLLMFIVIALLFPYHIHINISESAGGKANTAKKLGVLMIWLEHSPRPQHSFGWYLLLPCVVLPLLSLYIPCQQDTGIMAWITPPHLFFLFFFCFDEPTVIGTERNDMAANLYQFHNPVLLEQETALCFCQNSIRLISLYHKTAAAYIWKKKRHK